MKLCKLTVVAAVLLLSFKGICVPENLSNIFGYSGNTPYVQRIKYVHALGRDLPKDQIDAIYKFLHRKLNEDTLPSLEFNAIKNELTIVLMQQRVYPEDLTKNLIEMYYDKSFDKCWRDYCVQFLGQWFPKIHSDTERQRTVKLFYDALEEKDGIAGTSLIAMSRLTDYQGLEKERVSGEAVKLASDKDSADIVKTSALQVAANLKNKDIVPIARGILKNSKNIPLKMSAMAALGTMGLDSEDRAVIEKYRSSTDVRLRTAAKSALKK